MHWINAVAERFFSRADVNHCLLEFDTPRAGDFAPLAHVPNDKAVVLGLVSSKSPVLESPDEVKRRIDQASRHVAVERLALSPQCGFASAVSGNPLGEDDQTAKLRLVARLAHDVWGTAN